jgi:hypothetical protein
MADQNYSHDTVFNFSTREQKPSASDQGARNGPHTAKSFGTNAFVPPPMETIIGKSMRPENPPRTQAEAVTQPPDMRMPRSYVGTFVPPSIGMVTGESVMPAEGPGLPLAPSPSQAPESVQNPYYAAGFLKNYIGRDMRVEFLIGTSGALSDRTGTLMEVGASYIVLRPFNSDDLLMCDLYAIKFVTIYR